MFKRSWPSLYINLSHTKWAKTSWTFGFSSFDLYYVQFTRFLAILDIQLNITCRCATLFETPSYCMSRKLWPILSYYIKWVTTSWTYSKYYTNRGQRYCRPLSQTFLALKYFYLERQKDIFNGKKPFLAKKNFFSEKKHFLAEKILYSYCVSKK